MWELFSSSENKPLRLSLVGANTKKRKSTSIAGPASLNEENELNTSTNVLSKSSDSLKKNKVTTMANNMAHNIDTATGYLKSSCINANPSPNMSECGTEVSSVSERREWLKSFEKKQTSNVFRLMEKDKPRDSDDRNNHETRVGDLDKEGRQSPPYSSMNSAHTSASLPIETNVPVSNHSSTVISSALKPGSAKKPRKPRPVINRRASSGVAVPSWIAGKKEEVKATDDGCASVASLSKWLANDPTSAKKKRHVRRGRNILSKSRQFENDSENLIVMEAKITRGAVGDKKKWLQNAFQGTIEEDEDDVCSSFSGYVKSDVGRTMRSYPRYNRQDQHGAQTEIITDDAASSLSVADKKDWLKKAFVKNSEERKKLGYTNAQTDVMHNRRQPQDEAASRAKLRFKERSARKLLGATSTRPSGRTVPSVSSEDSNEGTNHVEPIEEDKTPVDFRAARDAIVQRSKQNGHDAQVINKVFLRKKKIERREDDSRRKSLGLGLVLKTSWDLADDSQGGPSNAYEKKYVPANDIAPKRSFEELP